MKIKELNHVALHVSDVERSSRFYGELLGLAAMERPAFSFPGAWFRLGADQELHLIGDRTEAVHSGNRGNHFALAVQSITETAAFLTERDVPHLPAKQRPDGVWQIYVVDPDGHYIEFCQTP